MTQQGNADPALPAPDYTVEERDALLLAGDLRERLQRERDAAARLRDFLFGTARHHRSS